ncbi:MAG: hypothetical protein OEW15_11570 [Nitrospirota bacterium]|nr:hypothetical protein [Nitrospirota bacterium]
MKRSIVNVIGFITLNLYLTACGSSGGGAADSSKTDPASPNPPSIVAPTPSNPTVSGTYYTLVKNATVSSGGNSYQITMTGHCAVLDSVDYCWDDGFQTVPAIGYKTSFWQICRTVGGVVGQCSSGTDPVDGVPTPWTEMAAKLVTPPFTPSNVYAQGIAT